LFGTAKVEIFFFFANLFSKLFSLSFLSSLSAALPPKRDAKVEKFSHSPNLNQPLYLQKPITP